MKTESMLQVAAVAVVGYLIYQALQTVKTGTSAASTALANWWLALFPNPPAMNVLGSVQFPNGTLVPLMNLPAPKSDSSGNVYVSYGGGYFQLGPSDVNGNWPATAVTGS